MLGKILIEFSVLYKTELILIVSQSAVRPSLSKIVGRIRGGRVVNNVLYGEAML